MSLWTRPADRNFQIYNSAEVASHYAELNQISPGERLLFETYIKPGAAILELGVGGGRTTGALSQGCSKYLGLDYAPEMVRVSQTKFPHLQFKVGDAAKLDDIASSSFDAVVAAFNVVDYVIPDDRRRQCWRECRRVLRPGGVLIFSSHNARSLLSFPDWNRERVRELSVRISGKGSFAGRVMPVIFSWVAIVAAIFRATWRTLYRTVLQFSRTAFWRGEGYVVDPSHGGLLTHCWIPGKAVAELEQCGFRTRRILGSEYPRTGAKYVTDWYYYVFAKSQSELMTQTQEEDHQKAACGPCSGIEEHAVHLN